MTTYNLRPAFTQKAAILLSLFAAFAVIVYGNDSTAGFAAPMSGEGSKSSEVKQQGHQFDKVS